MDPQLQHAITERITLGYDKQTILKELVSAGYTEAEAEKIHTAANGAVADTPTPTPSTPEPVATSEAAPAAPAAPTPPPTTAASEATTSTVTTTKEDSSHHGLWIVLVLIAGLLISGAIVLVYFTDVRNVVGQWMPAVFGGAPYTEVSLIPGLLAQSADVHSSQFTSKLHVNLEQREPETSSAFDDLFAMLEFMTMFGFILPDTAHYHLDVTGRIDAHEAETVRSDMQASVNIDFDFLNLTMTGSLRQIGTAVYGRIDDMPSTFRSSLGEFPYQTWVQLISEDSLENLPGGQFIQRAGEYYVLFNQPESLAAFEEGVPSVLGRSGSGSMLANVNQFVDLLPAETRSDFEEFMESVARVWQQHTPIQFVQAPYRIERDGESVYVYEIELNPDTLPRFYRALLDELEVYADEFIMAELRGMDMPTVAEVGLFNQIVDTSFYVRRDGSLQGMEVEGVFTSPEDTFAHQIRVLFSSSQRNVNEIFDIRPPTQLHDLTLDEIMFEQERQRRQAVMSASLQQTMNSARVSAEMYYNENQFSYGGLCTDQDFGVARTLSFLDIDIDEDVLCRDTDAGYIVIAQSPVEFAWCVDSQGNSLEVDYPLDRSYEELVCPGAHSSANQGSVVPPSGGGSSGSGAFSIPN